MSEHYNRLSPTEHEILTKLAEESSEIVKAACKIFSHGLDSHEPGHPYPDNRTKLEGEIADLVFFLGIAHEHGLIDGNRIMDAVRARAKRPDHYLHHIELPKE